MIRYYEEIGLIPAADHRRELGVEQGQRHLAGQVMKDLDVLTRGVEHFQHRRIGQQIEQRLQIDLCRQRVDRGMRRAPASWTRHSFGQQVRSRMNSGSSATKGSRASAAHSSASSAVVVSRVMRAPWPFQSAPA